MLLLVYVSSVEPSSFFRVRCSEPCSWYLAVTLALIQTFMIDESGTLATTPRRWVSTLSFPLSASRAMNGAGPRVPCCFICQMSHQVGSEFITSSLKRQV